MMNQNVSDLVFVFQVLCCKFNSQLIVNLSISFESLTAMSQTQIRKGTRQKKPPKNFEYDGEFPGYPVSRTNEPRAPHLQNGRGLNPAQENNQLAKLLCKLVQNSNQKYKDLCQHENAERQIKNGQNIPDNESRRERNSKRGDPRQNLSEVDNPANIANRSKEMREKGGQQSTQPSKSVMKKQGNPYRGNISLNQNIQPDIEYHNLLNSHIRNNFPNFPNINNISSEMLKGLQIPKQHQEDSLSKSKSKTDKHRTSKDNDLKQSMKPFKRQSYHLAIAYHIHLKKYRAGLISEEQIDPAYNSRKLRGGKSIQQHA